MAERGLSMRLAERLAGLTVPVRVTEVLPDGTAAEPVPADLTDDVVQQEDGRLWYPVRRQQIILSCAADAPSGRDVLQLAGALAESLAHEPGRIETGTDGYRRILMGEVDGPELDAICQEWRLPRRLPRCVLVVRAVDMAEGRTAEQLEEYAPLQPSDVVIDIDRHHAALVKDVTEMDGTGELEQYAQALEETMLNESALTLTIGISDRFTEMTDLHRAALQARSAMEIGDVFRPGDSIRLYSRMILERLLAELPEERCAEWTQQLFNSRTARLFDDEMLSTIEMFFRKDLNLSDTARQLYIHRNTLVYRLDKIQKQTGLDLRQFDDAITFRLLMELRKRSPAPQTRRKP